MSLVAWYPLNGDLKNYGTGAFPEGRAYSGDPSFISNGKIGKALRVANRNNAIRLPDTYKLIKDFTDFTFCSWFNIEDYPGDMAGPILCSGTWYDGKNLTFGAGWNYGGGKNTTRVEAGVYGNVITLEEELGLNTWHHMCCSKTGKIVSVYIDGVLQGTVTAPLFGVHQDIPDSRSDLTIGAEEYYSYSLFKGLINDLRLYDTALSAKEVAEIAKGLILHYPMNNIDGNISGRNLLKQYVKASSRCITTIPNVEIELNGGGDTYFHLRSNVALEKGATYTLSCDVENLPSNAKNWSFGIRVQNSGNFLTLGDNGRNSCTFVLDEAINKDSDFILDDSNRPQGTEKVNVRLSNFKLEKGPKATPYTIAPEDDPMAYSNRVYDCSGYGHDAVFTAASMPNWDTVAAIGQGTYKFNGNTYFRSNFTLSMTDATFSYWYKANASNGKYATIAVNSKKPTSGFWVASSVAESSPICWVYRYDGSNSQYVFGGADIKNTYKNDVWYHCCVVLKAGAAQCYINGEPSGSPNNVFGKFDINNLSIGNDYSGTSWETGQYGCIQDVRLYATALSAEAVKELYQIRFSIADNGVLFCDSVSEESENVSMGRNGVLAAADVCVGMGRENKITNAGEMKGTTTVPVGTNITKIYYISQNMSEKVIIPYGQAYLCSIWVKPSADCKILVDMNDYPLEGTAWSGNDNTSNRHYENAWQSLLKANEWTLVTWGGKNAHSGNTNHVSVYVQDAVVFYQQSDKEYTVEWKWPKLEFGEDYTPWVSGLNEGEKEEITKMSIYKNTVLCSNLIER